MVSPHPRSELDVEARDQHEQGGGTGNNSEESHVMTSAASR